MSLLKASAASAVGAGIKLLLGLVLIKLISTSLGPTGLGLMGQMATITSILSLLAGGGIATGVIKYVAEFKQDPTRLELLLSTARCYAMVASIAIFLVSIAVAEKLSRSIFNQPGYEYVIYLLGATQFGFALNNYLSSIAGGYKDIKFLNIISIIGALTSIVITAPLIHFFDDLGMLIGMAISPALSIIFSLPIGRKRYPQAHRINLKPNKEDAVQLFRFSLIVVISSITMPAAQLLIRSSMADHTGWEHVGYWQATVRLSDAYLLFINMVLAGYYMPRLSEIGPGREQYTYITQSLKRLLPIVGGAGVLIWSCQDLLIPALFSSDFMPAREMLPYQLLGDFFKIASYIMGYLAIANAWLKLSILGDVLQASLLLAFYAVFSTLNPNLAPSLGYVTCYFFYFIIVATLFYRNSRP